MLYITQKDIETHYKNYLELLMLSQELEDIINRFPFYEYSNNTTPFDFDTMNTRVISLYSNKNNTLSINFDILNNQVISLLSKIHDVLKNVRELISQDNENDVFITRLDILIKNSGNIVQISPIDNNEDLLKYIPDITRIVMNCLIIPYKYRNYIESFPIM